MTAPQRDKKANFRTSSSKPESVDSKRASASRSAAALESIFCASFETSVSFAMRHEPDAAEMLWLKDVSVA